MKIQGIRDDRYMNINLNKSISIPSAVHGYSIAIEYMKQWFLDKFKPDYFQTVHVNGKHVLADYRRFNPDQKTRMIVTPAVAITPTINIDFNRDNLDLLLHGSNVYTRRSPSYHDNFFSDYDKNIFIGLQMKQIEVAFAFHNRVNTRAMQLDLTEYIRLNHRIGATQGEYIDMDAQVPTDVMVAVAIDAGFDTKYDEKHQKTVVKDPIAFLNYLNQHSVIPFVYKYRTINGQYEYFIRMRACYMHISCLDGISIDDGERLSMLESNFHVDFTATLQMPIPAIFVYYSEKKHTIQSKELDSIYGTYRIIRIEPPEVNDKGWRQYLSTEWYDDSKKLDSIEFEELLGNEDLQRVIKHNVQIGLSPAMFMEVQIYNGQAPLDIKVDWEHYKIIIDQEVKDEVSQIAIYADLRYINETLETMENVEESRIRPTDKPLNQ